MNYYKFLFLIEKIKIFYLQLLINSKDKLERKYWNKLWEEKYLKRKLVSFKRTLEILTSIFYN